MRVLVTGGTGFLGRHLMRKLAAAGGLEPLAVGRSHCDLTQPDKVRQLLSDTKPQAIIHLAAVCGGIGANRAEPGRFLLENSLMGLHVLEEARRAGVQKVVLLGSVCAYPKDCPVPFREEDLWNGYPEPTNAPYGIAKKLIAAQSAAYRDQYGFNSITLLPANLYGPGDCFDLERGHVVPAMIRKFIQAKGRGDVPVVLWGDGTPTREFLYVEDAAAAIVAALATYDRPEPLNLGTGHEISMLELARMIAGLVGFRGDIVWDHTRPNGQPRRCLDTQKAAQLLGWRAQTQLLTGLAQTIFTDWWRAFDAAS